MNRAKTYTNLLFDCAVDEQVPSYLVGFFTPVILQFVLRLAKPRLSLDF